MNVYLSLSNELMSYAFNYFKLFIRKQLLEKKTFLAQDVVIVNLNFVDPGLKSANTDITLLKTLGNYFYSCPLFGVIPKLNF